MFFYITDAPFNPVYTQGTTVFNTSLGSTVHITVPMLAFPVDVTFIWSLCAYNQNCSVINSTDERYQIAQVGMISVLTVTHFQTSMAGYYKIYGRNSVRTGKV